MPDLYDFVAAIGVAISVYFIVGHHIKRAETRRKREAQVQLEEALRNWQA